VFKGVEPNVQTQLALAMGAWAMVFSHCEGRLQRYVLPAVGVVLNELGNAGYLGSSNLNLGEMVSSSVVQFLQKGRAPLAHGGGMPGATEATFGMGGIVLVLLMALSYRVGFSELPNRFLASFFLGSACNLFGTNRPLGMMAALAAFSHPPKDMLQSALQLLGYLASCLVLSKQVMPEMTDVPLDLFLVATLMGFFHTSEQSSRLTPLLHYVAPMGLRAMVPVYSVISDLFLGRFKLVRYVPVALGYLFGFSGYQGVFGDQGAKELIQSNVQKVVRGS
jgi:hypothetical protein